MDCLVEKGFSLTSVNQPEKIAAMVKAANVTIESYWPSLFAKLVEKKNIEDLIMNVGSGGGAAAPVAVVASAAPAASAVPAAEEKKVKTILHSWHAEYCFEKCRALCYLIEIEEIPVGDRCLFLAKILQEEAKEESDDDGLGFSLFDD